MAKKGSNLRRALDRFQGKDYSKLKDKKLQKDAQKRKGTKKPTVDEIEVDEEELDDDELEVEEFDENGNLVGGGEVESFDEDEDEDDDSDDEEIAKMFNPALLEESDSESELDSDQDDDEDSEEDEEEEEEASNGVSLNKPKSKTSKPSTTANDDEDDEDEDEASDIALSDLSDTEDIVPHQRLTINNKAALDRALARIALPLADLPFSEHQSITGVAPTVVEDAEDDLSREQAFYAQSLHAVREARAKLRAEGVAFTRPADFFAEMVKSDEHMGKVKGRLVAEAAGKQASADAKKQRELKKFGKQVQQEKLRERAAAKRDMLDKVKALKRKRADGDGALGATEDDIFDVALEDAAETARKDKAERRARGPTGGAPNAKRAKRDAKFGFGGKKRFAKSNDAQSSSDMRGFSAKKMKASAKGAARRPGKSRRVKSRLS